MVKGKGLKTHIKKAHPQEQYVEPEEPKKEENNGGTNWRYGNRTVAGMEC